MVLRWGRRCHRGAEYGTIHSRLSLARSDGETIRRRRTEMFGDEKTPRLQQHSYLDRETTIVKDY